MQAKQHFAELFGRELHMDDEADANDAPGAKDSGSGRKQKKRRLADGLKIGETAEDGSSTPLATDGAAPSQRDSKEMSQQG